MFYKKIVALKKRRIFQDFSWVSVGTILSAFFSLLFMKVIAFYITPSVYGNYALHLQILLLLNAVFVLPFLQAFLKFFKSEEGDLKKVFRFYNSVLLFILVVLLPIIIVCFELFFDVSLWQYFLFFLFVCGTAFKGYLNNVLYIQRKQKSVAVAKVIMQFIPFVMLSGLTAILFVRNELGIWISQCIGIFIAFSYLYIKTKQERKTYSFFSYYSIYDNEFMLLFKKNIIYVLPLVLFGLFSWISNVSDRYIIDYFLNKEQVGLYSAGYGLASRMMMTVGGILLTTVKPVMFDYYHNDKKRYFNYKKKLYIIYLSGGIVLIAGIYFFSDMIGFIFLSEKYRGAFGIIFIISVAYFLVNLIYLTELSFYASGKTKYILYAMVVGAIVNIILNIIFIPIWEIYGAAFATVSGFFVQFVIVFLFYYRFIKKDLL